jgi:hypothetical protein
LLSFPCSRPCFPEEPGATLAAGRPCSACSRLRIFEDYYRYSLNRPNLILDIFRQSVDDL